jgi:MYXO-CTERM domain-containing protein
VRGDGVDLRLWGWSRALPPPGFLVPPGVSIHATIRFRQRHNRNGQRDRLGNERRSESASSASPSVAADAGFRRFDRSIDPTDAQQPIMMKPNVKTYCAVGAMLFGGTVGAAHAGVVGLPGRPAGGPSSWAYLKAVSHDSFTNVTGEKESSGNPANTAVWVDGYGASGGYGEVTQFSGSGFSFWRTSQTGTRITAVIDQYFQVYGNFRFSLTAGLLPGNEVAISHYNANHEIQADSIYVNSPGSVSLSGTLTDGVNSLGDYYLFRFTMTDRSGIGGSSNETLFNLSFSPVLAVPAPGAIALIGLAGLAGRRRRISPRCLDTRRRCRGDRPARAR